MENNEAWPPFSVSVSLKVFRQDGRGATTNDVGGDGTQISFYVEEDVHYIGYAGYCSTCCAL